MSRPRSDPLIFPPVPAADLQDELRQLGWKEEGKEEGGGDGGGKEDARVSPTQAGTEAPGIVGKDASESQWPRGDEENPGGSEKGKEEPLPAPGPPSLPPSLPPSNDLEMARLQDAVRDSKAKAVALKKEVRRLPSSPSFPPGFFPIFAPFFPRLGTGDDLPTPRMLHGPSSLPPFFPPSLPLAFLSLFLTRSVPPLFHSLLFFLASCLLWVRLRARVWVFDVHPSPPSLLSSLPPSLPPSLRAK